MTKPYYQDEWVTIYHGDCREILPELPKVDLVLTDPFYGSSGRDGSVHLNNDDIFGNRMSRESFVWFVGQYSKQLFKGTDPSSHCYVFSDWRKYKDVQIAFEINGWELRALIVWNKGNGMDEFWRSTHEFILFFTQKSPRKLLHGGCMNVLNFPPVRGRNKLHNCEKPVGLFEYLIEASSSENDLILDPFLGSGTTAYCAKKLNRKCIGIEIKEKYCEIAAKRCCQSVMELKV